MITIRSHYLPQTYLKHFLHEDSLFMYKKGEAFFKKGGIPEDRILEVIGEASLVNIGVENHLYNPQIEGINSDNLEEIFQELGENTYDRVIESIYQLPEGSAVPKDVKDQLCLFMAAMRVRTPLFKREIEEMGEGMTKHMMSIDYERMSIEEIKVHAKETTGQDISNDFANQIKTSFVNKEYELKYPNAYFIKYALLLVERHADIFHQMTMTICKTDGRLFITNDSPLVYFVPPEHVNVYNPPKGLVTPFCEVFFPLTKKLAVHMCWRKQDELVGDASRKLIDIFNYNIAHNSYNYIFAPIKTKELDKFTQEFIPYPYKFTIS